MVGIRLYNGRTRAKEDFTPIDDGNVRIYVCGPTVYDRAHIGNARPVVVFDVLFRLLRHVYGPDHVTYVRNFTDVDDKIIARAAATGREIGAITEETIGWYHQDMDALGALRPTHEPRATEYIGAMIAMIAGLIGAGHAYEAEGHVLFDVRSYPDYGRLSGRSIDDMIAGARVEVAPYKRDPMDFVLWKPSDAATPGWDSPWGYGRPGWHIECSAMSDALLGASFDIHGGGIDLQFPHHENELAQSACAHPGAGFAQVWMHNEMLQVEGRKMSKSLGNFFTIREVLKQYDPEVVRFFILRAHYRSPLNYSDAHLDDAKKALDRLYTALKSNPPSLVREGAGMSGGGSVDWTEPYAARFKAAMDDDFNTPEAVAVLFDLANEVNRSQSASAALLLRALGGVLGLLQRDPNEFLQGAGSDDAMIIEQIAARNAAKQAKNYAEADRIRKALLAGGIVLEDSAAGTNWRRV